MSSDDTATTYEKKCPETTTPTSTPSPTYLSEESAREASLDSMISWALSFYETAVPIETPESEVDGCIPFTMLQGPETWEFHMTITSAITRNGACTWTGVLTEVPVTCDADFYNEKNSILSGTPTIFSQSELRAWSNLRFAMATIVGATSTPTPASTSEASGAKETGVEASDSEGRAPGMPLPTGAILMVGGAAAFGGAAWGF
ncbi:hypothetical protein J4E91_010545 [Alternaria rosae]|nr:hypothetical protein J4E91_010545 [Alternaria rosae]